jgi:hypothetical protein
MAALSIARISATRLTFMVFLSAMDRHAILSVIATCAA